MNPEIEGGLSAVGDIAVVYSDTLRAKLREYGAEVLPLPQTSHSAILDRDLAVRKPFRENGKGYRDALL